MNCLKKYLKSGNINNFFKSLPDGAYNFLFFCFPLIICFFFNFPINT